MVRYFGHLRFGLQYDEDRIEELSPKNIPEFLRVIATVSDQRFEKVCQSSGSCVSQIIACQGQRELTVSEPQGRHQSSTRLGTQLG